MDITGSLRVLGVNSQLTAFTSGGSTDWNNDFGDLVDQSHQDWVRSRLDQDANGLVDLTCAGGSHLQWDTTLSVSADLDADGVANGIDNCPTRWNPCQEDLNANGIGNACDSCGGSSVDSDGDGFLDGCDNCPNEPNTDQRDSDRDGVGDACDKCPTVFTAPGAPDTDGDGAPDVCDPCPLVPNEDANDREGMEPGDDLGTYGDGVPDACDNCKDDGNSYQENCNIDAERVEGLFDPGAGLFGIGDVCDPTPCGETRVVAQRERIVDELRLAHRLVIDARGFKETDGMPVPAGIGFRFCTCDDVAGDSVEERIRCSQPTEGNCVISASQYSATITNWRRVSAGGAAGTETGAVAHERPVPLTQRAPLSFEEDANVLWDSRKDRDLWGEPVGPMGGVLWTHSLATARTLTSHYWAGAVDDSFTVRAPLPCLRHVGPLFAWAGCPTCEASFPSGFVVAPELVNACGTAPDWGIRFLDDVFASNAAPDLGFDSAFDGYEDLVFASRAEPPARVAGLAHVAVSPLFDKIYLVEVDASGTYVSSSRPTSPPPKLPFSGDPLVVSARLHAVFALRSQDREMYVLDGGRDRWRTQPLSNTLGTVLAASYDETSGWLIVLEAHAPEVMRLRRIDPVSGQTHAIRGSVLPRENAKAWGLALAPDGAAYLVVGNGSESVVLRGTMAASTQWRGESVLSSPYVDTPSPVATDLGVSFLVKTAGGSSLTGVLASELLAPDPNHWKDIL